MFLVSAVPLLPIDYFKGQFYSRSGVCLALHITTHRPPGWEYSVAVFLFANLLAFLMIVFCYCYMYSTIKRSKKKMKSMITQKQDREARVNVTVQLPIILIIFSTDWLADALHCRLQLLLLVSSDHNGHAGTRRNRHLRQCLLLDCSLCPAAKLGN